MQAASFRRSVLPALALTALLAGCTSSSAEAAKPSAPHAPTPPAAPVAQAPPTAPKALVAPAAPSAPATAVASKPATPAAPSQPAAPAASNPENAMPAPAALPATFHDFKTTTLEGQPASLSQYKGKVLLVVNTASECGLTPQYAGLEKLQAELAPRGLTVLGFPSNDFGGQEPGTPAQIREFCDVNYHVTFPLFSKVQTKPGDGQSPIYTWLNEKTGSLPRWNFGKYVIGKDGKTVTFFDSKVTPEDPALRTALEKALGS